MVNEQEAAQALQELLGALQRIGAEELAREIRLVVARGTVRTDQEAKDADTIRTPYSARDAYAVAVRLLLAAVDPALMDADTCAELGALVGVSVDAIWAPDFLEGAQFGTDLYQEVPQIGLIVPSISELRARAKQVLEKHDHVVAEHELLLTE